jgi:hypothetical protein
MHVYRNRRYYDEEEIGMLKCHGKGEHTKDGKNQQKTQIQAHHMNAESATQTHTQIQTKDYVHGI